MKRRDFIKFAAIVMSACNNDKEMRVSKIFENWCGNGNQQSLIDGLTDWDFFGDSIMFGREATAGNSYRELLDAAYNLTGVNYSDGGTGVWLESKSRIQNAAWLSNDHSTNLTIISAGLNDLRRSASAQTWNKVKTSIPNIVAKCFSFSATNYNAGSGFPQVVRTGTWTGFAMNSLGGNTSSSTLGDNTAGARTSVAGSKITFELTGDKLFVRMIGAHPGLTYGTYTVKIDGNLVYTENAPNQYYDNIADPVYDNSRGPYTLIFTGLGLGTHYLEIEATSSNTVPIDTAGSLFTSGLLGKVIVLGIPYLLDYLKPGSDQTNEALITAMNLERKAQVDYYKSLGFPIYYIPLNIAEGGLYDFNETPDGIHPSNVGHLQIYNTIVSYF